MKSKFKNQLCVYCVERPAETGDHVVSREFFLTNRRHNLPQVPACRECNNEKAKLEYYLTAVLPFGGRHADAFENLNNLVPRRLAKNAKLNRQLRAGYDASGGTAIPIDHTRIEKLFAMIAQGLAWHHWKVLLGDGYGALGSIFADTGEAFFNFSSSHWNTPHRVAENLGDGTFRYEGAQLTDCLQATVWRFWMYGGIRFGGDPNVTGESSLAIAMTGPSTLVEKLRATAAARPTYRAKDRVAKQASLRKVGRNQPCPCGSGQKYKKCHGAIVPKSNSTAKAEN